MIILTSFSIISDSVSNILVMVLSCFVTRLVDIPNSIENIIRGSMLLRFSKLPKSVTVNISTILSLRFSVDKVSVVFKIMLLFPNGLIIFTIIKANIEEIKLVIRNTMNRYFNILPSLFRLIILAMLEDIVKNTNGTTIVNMRFKNMVPNGFRNKIFFLNINPIILPRMTDIIRTIGLLIIFCFFILSPSNIYESLCKKMYFIVVLICCYSF